MQTASRLALTLTAVLTLAACNPADRVSDKDIQPIDYNQLVNLLDDPGANVLLLDVRRPADYAAGHLPGSVNIFLPDLNRYDRRLATAGTIVVYASGEANDPLAPAAVKALIGQGYKSVRDFRGGMRVWRAEGGDVVSPATGE